MKEERELNKVNQDKESNRDHAGVDPNPDSNPDPITGEPGSHPVGVGLGGGAGAAAGAAIGGVVGGPVGAAAGAVIGAVAGAAAGKGVAEKLDPTVESQYWQQNYRTRSYITSGSKYEDYEPAYRYGWESASKPEFQNRKFEDVEEQLQREWPAYDSTRSNWGDRREAVRDAYNRIFEHSRGKGNR